jgi:galactokinase
LEDNEGDMSLKDNRQRVYLTVPGRLCLFGEHTDWVSEYQRTNPNIPSGKAIVCLVDMQITAIAEISNFVCFSAEMNGRQYAVQCELFAASIEKAIIGNPIFAYVLSTCSYMINRYGVGGIDIKVI